MLFVHGIYAFRGQILGKDAFIHKKGVFMDKPPRNPSLSMKPVLFMDNCLLKCSLSMELALFMDKSSGIVSALLWKHFFQNGNIQTQQSSELLVCGVIVKAQMAGCLDFLLSAQQLDALYSILLIYMCDCH